MLHRRLHFSIAFLFCLFCVGTPVKCCGEGADTEQDLRAAVARLNSWLGSDDNARRWRKFLNLNVLDAQAALGYDANAAELEGISNRFHSDADGLQHSVFRQTAAAIDAHLNNLANRHRDVLSQLVSSRNSFVPSTLAEMNQLRDRAVYEIKLLKRYYKKNLTSRSFNAATQQWTRLEGKPHQVEFTGFAATQVSMLKSASRPIDVYRFISWLGSKQTTSAIMSTSPTGSPTRAAHLGNIEVWIGNRLNTDTMDQYSDLLLAASESPIYCAFPRIPGSKKYWTALEAAVQSFLAGKVDSKTALQQAASRPRICSFRRSVC